MLRCASIVLVSLFACAAQAQGWSHARSLVPGEDKCDAHAFHGSSVALLYAAGDAAPGWVLGGAPECAAGTPGGRVQVDALAGASPLVASLGEGGTQAGDRLGHALAAARSGVFALASPHADPGARPFAGRVQVFHKGPGVANPQLEFIAQRWGELSGDRFGFALDVDADLLAVASPGPDGPGAIGRVDVFRVDVAASKLHWIDTVVAGTPGAGFGRSVAIRRDSSSQLLLLIGEPHAEAAAGRVHAYQLTAEGRLKRSATLRATAPQPGDRFGTSLDIDESAALVGAPGRNKPGVGRTGSVLLFARSQPLPPTTLDEYFPPLAADGDECGSAIAVSGDGDVAFRAFAAGCPGADSAGADSGAVYTWREFCLVTCVGRYGLASWSKPMPGARLGASVAIHGGITVLAGAPGRARAGVPEVGSVEEFHAQ
jgi:hypothetical protein